MRQLAKQHESLATMHRRQSVLHDYLGISDGRWMHRYVPSYRHRSNFKLENTHLRREYIGDYLVHVSMDTYTVLVGETIGDEELSNWASSRRVFDDIVEVLVPPGGLE